METPQPGPSLCMQENHEAQTRPIASTSSSIVGANNAAGRPASLAPLCTPHDSRRCTPTADLEPNPGVLLTEHHEVRRPLITTLDWDIKEIIASSPNFYPITRAHYSSRAAETCIREYEKTGIPYIINGWRRHPQWPKSMFNVEWLRKNGDQNPTVRNVHTWTDFKLPVSEFIEKLRQSSVYAGDDEQERLYGKDGECPAAWTEWLTGGVIPETLLFDGSNDLLKFLPDTAKVATLMCYMGIGDTFTPFHKDLCASSGHNLMCYTERSGSSFWFMTKASAAPQVASYFHQLGQEVDLETHVVTIEELAKAPFDIYVGEQQLGDLVLVPPRSCHQVINKGGITIKTSWSRMTLDGLQTALWHELPIYHRVCRQEIYKVKSNIYHALQHFTGIVENPPEHSAPQNIADYTEKLKQLIRLFDDVIAEDFSTTRDYMPHVSKSGSLHQDNLHCDFCGADVFQSFFECDSCVSPPTSGNSQDILAVGDGLVLCPSCYVEGRTCRCEEMQPVQCRPFDDLLQTRDRAVKVIQAFDNSFIPDYGYLSECPNQLLSGRHAGIFEAACKLFQQRQVATKTIRSCRVRARLPSHQVVLTAAIPCKMCHSSKCYSHLLEADSLHSVEAIFESERHDANQGWHRHHRSSRQIFQSSQQRIIADEENGVRPDMLRRLTHLAKKFSTCRTIAPEFTRHGWYDRYSQTTVIPIAANPGKVLVGLPEDIDDDGTSTSEASLHGSASGSVKQRSSYRGDSPRTSTFRPASRPASAASARSTSAAKRGPAAMVVDQMSPGIALIPTSVVDVAKPAKYSRSANIGAPPREPPGHETVVSATPVVSAPSFFSENQEGLGNPNIGKSLSSAFVRSPGTGEAGSLSDLTELPTEFNSSPLARPPIVATDSMSDVPDSQPPTPSTSSPFLPSSAQEASSSSPRPNPKPEPKKRVFLDCVEIQRPQTEWYEKMKTQMQAMSMSSSPGKRKQSEVSVSEDDMPVEDLLRRRPGPSSLRRHSGPFPRVLSPLSSDISGVTPAPSIPSASTNRLAAEDSPSIDQLVTSANLPPPARKRKISQSAASRPPPPSKRTRSSGITFNRPSDGNLIANALNETFKINSSTGRRDISMTRNAANTPSIISGAAAAASTNIDGSSMAGAFSTPNTSRQYRVVSVPKNLKFTRTPTAASTEDQSNRIARLEAENRALQAALEESERERQILQETNEELKRQMALQASRSSAPHTPCPPSASTPYAAPRFERQCVQPIIIPAHQPGSTHVQEPQHPPIETLPPLTPSSRKSSVQLSDTLLTQVPSRRAAPTEPQSHGLRSAEQQQGKAGNSQQGGPGRHVKQWKGYGRRRGYLDNPLGTNGMRRSQVSTPALSDVQVTEAPLPPNTSTIIEAGPSTSLSPTATVRSSSKDHLPVLSIFAPGKLPPSEDPAEQS